MPGNIVLINPARHFIANRAGIGYLTPLGLVFLGGPLLDAGHRVKLIDHDLYGWPMARLLDEVSAFGAGYALLGHSGSTASHDVAVSTIRSLRNAIPQIKIVYGGVYPTYAFQSIMEAVPEVDIIVRGEGEQTVVDCLAALEAGTSLETVQGIVWREGQRIVVNPTRPPLADLDRYRPGWELLDWPRYQMFGFHNVAGFQFSRGCTLTCSYCGQWLFWKKWRHRSPENVVRQLDHLARTCGVTMVWFADENFAADRAAIKRLLELIVEARLGLSLNVNMTAADVVRDADLMPLYKAAGVDYVVMGVESLKDSVIEHVRKNNPFAVSREAVRVLRQHHILSLTNLIYGLEQESWSTLVEKFKGMLALDSDILNAMYLMPHFWTLDGRTTDPRTIIQHDLSKWSYRNQVLAVENLSPAALFAGVKLTEALYHLRPRSLGRLVRSADKRFLQIFRHSIRDGIRVWLAEIHEFLTEVRFAPPGRAVRIPGQPSAGRDSMPLGEEAR